MQKSIVFFIYQNPFIVRLRIERPYFISFISLYPISGIAGNYFNDEVNFYQEESYPVIKHFLFNNLLPLHVLHGYNETLTYEWLKRSFDATEVEKIYRDTLDEIDVSFFSKDSLQFLNKTAAQYMRFQTFSFKIIGSRVMSD